ncbi:hypothetical protein ACKWTF_010757 [Chironomus riparius]
MPSANVEPLKVEVVPPKPSDEAKTNENPQKDMEHNGEKIPPIQQVLQIIQNKVRNLEKRKNKLDGYMKEEEDGKELSNEQKKAVLKYEEVVSQLGISKEFCKQFQVMATTAAKEQKRLERKATFIKQMQETRKVREVIIIQDILRQLKNEEIRSDFLNAQNGACLVEASEMDVLELFSKHTIPVHPMYSNEPSFVNSAKTAADLLSFVVDGRNRQFLETGFTFDKMKEIFTRIQTCGYFETDIKIVEIEERPPESATPQSNTDLDSKDENAIIEDVILEQPAINAPSIPSTSSSPSNAAANIMPQAPLPTQVPNPTQLFNGGNNVQGINVMPVMHAPIQVIPQPLPMKTTVTAVENAFYNQMKYSQPQQLNQQPQGPMINNNINANANNTNNINNNNNNNINNNGNSNNEMQVVPPNRYIEDFASSSISFLQDSLVEQIQSGSQSPQQKIPPNMLNQPPKHSNIQQQQQQQVISTQTYSSQTYNPPQQSAPVQPQTTHNFPPGLKLQQQQQQGNASNIPVSYSQQHQPSSQTQQAPINSIPHQVPAPQKQQQHLMSKESTPQEAPHFQNIVAGSVQYQQQMPTNIQNLQDVEQKALNAHQPNVDVPSDKPTSETPDRKMHAVDKENNRSNEWNPVNNQQQPQIDTWTNDNSGGTNAGSGYNRFTRNRGAGGGPKYNNYRNSQVPRNNYNNENGDANNRDGGPTTFFRNNERYNSGSAGRYNHNNGNNVSERGNFNKRDNYRTGGSGRFSSSMGSSNPVQRK